METYYDSDNINLYLGDSLSVLQSLDSESVQCIVTSPPYWGLRDYNNPEQLGLEKEIDDYIGNLTNILREAKRVLKKNGTMWLNIGDSYAGSGKGPPGNLNKNHQHLEHKHSAIVPKGLKPKDLCGIPWRVAFKLQSDGWYLRSDIIWSKPSVMPESVKDRPTRSHEYLFLLTKNKKYYYDYEAIKEPSVNDDNELRNKRDVWTVNTANFKGAHFAVFPPKLIEPCILAGSKTGDVVLDPFNGSGTTGVVCINNNRKYIGIDINADYLNMTMERLNQGEK